MYISASKGMYGLLSPWVHGEVPEMAVAFPQRFVAAKD